MPSIAIKLIYEKRASADGMRILVNRLWPRAQAKMRLPSTSGARRSRRASTREAGALAPVFGLRGMIR